jgi:D-alanyl-lipoteichoic acid acyltransferase DltB (MBOAT superfamily)
MLYWFVFKSRKQQNILLIIASYVFYGWWDWRFLSLIIFSSTVDYFVGLSLARTDLPRNRRLLLFTSIFINIGFLGFFKYYNFFLENFVEAFSLFGQQINPQGLNIILPVGISFYTFQTLSYSIDVFRKKLEPTRDVISFFAFVSFFPQLVAGPIERATNLLPQFFRCRKFDRLHAVDGMRQILWGLFKKIVIADNAAIYANDIFNNYTDYYGSTLVLGVVFFAFQIYGDFSGYSDIAIGTSRLFGFKLMRNFAYPYFSRDIAEFWRRWHISLSSWFRDYLYIPLGGSRGDTMQKVRNIFVIFIISGFWHGANWTFIIWGALNALYFLPLLLLNKNRVNTNIVAEGKIFPNIKEIFQMVITFILTNIAWVFFRAESFGHAMDYFRHMFSASLFSLPMRDIWAINTGFHIIYLLLAIFAFIIIEWIQRARQHALEFDGYMIPGYVRWSIYYILIISCFIMNGIQQDFIYFQF